MKTLVTTALALAAFAAGPAGAQDPQQRPMMPMDGAMMQMHAMMSMEPSVPMLLRMRERLGLTGEQVQRLETIQREGQQAHQPHMQAAMQGMQEAQRLLQAERPNWDEYREELVEAAEHAALAHAAMTRTSHEARAVLTPQQRERLEMGMGMMREMMMMQGGMPGMGGAAPSSTPGAAPQHQH